MKIITTQQSKAADRYTIECEPIASIDLMERASLGFVKVFAKRFPAGKGWKVVVLAGHGNNGGDALAIARWLSGYSYPVEAILYNPKGMLSPDCALNLERLKDTPVVLTEDRDFTTFPELSKQHIVIDGLFGSGLNAPLQGGYSRLIDRLNASGAHVVAIDMPSGLFGEDNSQNDSKAIVRADLTLTFHSPKLSFFFPENEPFVGQWQAIDIRLHPEALEKIETPYYLITESEIKNLLRTRNRFSHKGTFGHALLVAGSYGKMGAAVLASKACLRTGAGLLSCLVPKAGVDIIQTAVPEAMACTELPEIHFAAIGIGPGIGMDKETVTRFSTLLNKSRKPMVLDADALNILSAYPQLKNQIHQGSILTPHPKEFDRIAGESDSSYKRLQKALKLAARLRVYIVLKGAYTAICSPDGDCFFNTTGNAGMATAGSGDVLTGIILSLLCQGYTPKESALIGVYLHGMTGDEAIRSGLQSEESLMAGDLSEMTGRCFKKLRE